jgi:RNA polymerase sigma factor (TIGR02999 family)
LLGRHRRPTRINASAAADLRSIASLPACAWVNVGPPLFCSGPIMLSEIRPRIRSASGQLESKWPIAIAICFAEMAAACAGLRRRPNDRYDSAMSETGHQLPVDPTVAWDGGLPSEVRALADQLLPLFYDDLKRLAHRERSRVGAGATLQTTALVNEAYLKLRGTQSWNTDAHFLRAAALAMRHALVNHAVARMADKRGSGVVPLPMSAALDVAAEDDATMLALNEALGRLAGDSLRLAQVVECRYFAGYDDAETALALGISERTVRRDWTLARAWLHRELADTTGGRQVP